MLITTESISQNIPLEDILKETIGEIKSSYKLNIKTFNLQEFLKDKTLKDLNKVENNIIDKQGKERLEVLFYNKTHAIYLYEYSTEFEIIIYSNDFAKAKEVYDNLKQYITFESEEPEAANNISVLIDNGHGLSLKSLNTKSELILDNYPLSFNDVYNKMVSTLSEKSKGIMILYGEPGTGKTSLVKSICNDVDKKFIFIPPSFVDALVSPNFLTFMLNHPNSVLIIEDAESVLANRKTTGNATVSNILNLTDGILSELLNIQIICTLNCSITSIDEAVRRPGRLLLEHEFVALSIEEANNRLMQLYPDENIQVEHPCTIAQIYTKQFKTAKDPSKREVGFKRKEDYAKA